MDKTISKSKFKSKALEYFRDVERSKNELIITDRGKPVLKISPYSEDPKAMLNKLKNSVLKYDDPTEPVGVEEWSALN